ncbi:MAG: hypothetical protein BJ554DRAFT_8411, partial [Olpidium bornovanus]
TSSLQTSTDLPCSVIEQGENTLAVAGDDAFHERRQNGFLKLALFVQSFFRPHLDDYTRYLGTGVGQDLEYLVVGLLEALIKELECAYNFIFRSYWKNVDSVESRHRGLIRTFEMRQRGNIGIKRRLPTTGCPADQAVRVAERYCGLGTPVGNCRSDRSHLTKWPSFHPVYLQISRIEDLRASSAVSMLPASDRELSTLSRSAFLAFSSPTATSSQSLAICRARRSTASSRCRGIRLDRREKTAKCPTCDPRGTLNAEPRDRRECPEACVRRGVVHHQQPPVHQRRSVLGQLDVPAVAVAAAFGGVQQVEKPPAHGRITLKAGAVLASEGDQRRRGIAERRRNRGQVA